MKWLFSEYTHNYETYTFGYAIYGLMDPSDQLYQVYAQGLLPYTGATEYTEGMRSDEIFYLARSVRIARDEFSLSSENRRVLRKAAEMGISCNIYEKNALNLDEGLIRYCQSYASERYKQGDMSEDRLTYVWQRKCLTHIAIYEIASTVIGYVFLCADAHSTHFWFSFFDTQFMHKLPLGKYLMLDSIQRAFIHGCQYMYLGTCYGEGSLYKVRDFKGISFFDGQGWNPDLSKLKEHILLDHLELSSDRWKLNRKS